MNKRRVWKLYTLTHRPILSTDLVCEGQFNVRMQERSQLGHLWNDTETNPKTFSSIKSNAVKSLWWFICMHACFQECGVENNNSSKQFQVVWIF